MIEWQLCCERKQAKVENIHEDIEDVVVTGAEVDANEVAREKMMAFLKEQKDKETKESKERDAKIAEKAQRELEARTCRKV